VSGRIQTNNLPPISPSAFASPARIEPAERAVNASLPKVTENAAKVTPYRTFLRTLRCNSPGSSSRDRSNHTAAKTPDTFARSPDLAYAEIQRQLPRENVGPAAQMRALCSSSALCPIRRGLQCRYGRTNDLLSPRRRSKTIRTFQTKHRAPPIRFCPNNDQRSWSRFESRRRSLAAFISLPTAALSFRSSACLRLRPPGDRKRAASQNDHSALEQLRGVVRINPRRLSHLRSCKPGDQPAYALFRYF